MEESSNAKTRRPQRHKGLRFRVRFHEITKVGLPRWQKPVRENAGSDRKRQRAAALQDASRGSRTGPYSWLVGPRDTAFAAEGGGRYFAGATSFRSWRWSCGMTRLVSVPAFSS